MIYGAMNAIQAKFLKRKFPTIFEYGPRRTAVETTYDHFVVVERDRDATDQLASVNGVNENPRRVCNRQLAVKATIYAQSRLGGARVNEHEFECEQIVDAFVVALQEWGGEARARLGGVAPTVSELRYLKASEFLGGEQWPGVAYMIRFRVARGVYARDYEGQGNPVGLVSHVANEVNVRESDADDPEILELPNG